MPKRCDIQIRDPFVFTDTVKGRYYLFGTTDRQPWNSTGTGFDVYVGHDLENWDGPFVAFRPQEGFWGTHDFWAPEVHAYRGRYYMLASFKSALHRRGTQILSSADILGPYEPLVPSASTPAQWECLDGTLCIDSLAQPWLVFCHEWVQVNDGEIWAQPLSGNLKTAVGEPMLLFKASEATWTYGLRRRDGSGCMDGRVTDGPFLYRTGEGSLLLLWSSVGEHGYVMGVAYSESGTLKGPWHQHQQPLIDVDGGHGMVFRTLEGRAMLAFHRPNKTPFERFIYLPVSESPDNLVLAGSPLETLS